MTLGSQGEEIAEKYLKQKGYVILERNFRCRCGEIDIIAENRSGLVFVEVKTRRSQKYGLPCESVNAAKQRHIKRTAACYIAAKHIEHRDVRLDVIEILTMEGQTYIHHIENILG